MSGWSLILCVGDNGVVTESDCATVFYLSTNYTILRLSMQLPLRVSLYGVGVT
jgi:hypothetical protein